MTSNSPRGTGAPGFGGVRLLARRASRRRLLLRFAQLARGAIEDGVDELVAVGGAKLLRQLHALVQDHFVWHLDVRAKFLDTDQQYRVLDRVELCHWSI